MGIFSRPSCSQVFSTLSLESKESMGNEWTIVWVQLESILICTLVNFISHEILLLFFFTKMKAIFRLINNYYKFLDWWKLEQWVFSLSFRGDLMFYKRSIRLPLFNHASLSHTHIHFMAHKQNGLERLETFSPSNFINLSVIYTTT